MDLQAVIEGFDLIEELIIKTTIVVALALFCLLYLKHHFINLRDSGKQKSRKNSKNTPRPKGH